ncbi:hypothetical protein OG21DRAFT_221775 [Imleria badia]|nr:hypothetical protein OG21DRAFT_221775 [Imleria badia]
MARKTSLYTLTFQSGPGAHTPCPGLFLLSVHFKRLHGSLGQCSLIPAWPCFNALICLYYRCHSPRDHRLDPSRHSVCFAAANGSCSRSVFSHDRQHRYESCYCPNDEECMGPTSPFTYMYVTSFNELDQP